MFIIIPIGLALAVGGWYYVVFFGRGAGKTTRAVWGVLGAVAQFMAFPIIDQIAKAYFRNEWRRMFMSGADAPIIAGWMLGTAIVLALLAPVVARAVVKKVDDRKTT